MQIGWVDIVSPRLRALHQEWIRWRGSKMMPGLPDYKGFLITEAATLTAPFTASVAVPSDADSSLIRHVAPPVAGLMGGCQTGQRLLDLTSMVDRVRVAQPFRRIVAGRQPECRRQPPGRSDQGHEALLLPFGDGGLKVRLIHAAFDIDGIDWKRFFG
jgi:hypothetical protein